MKHQIRLALPPLQQLSSDSRIRFAVLDRRGRVLRSGELALNALATALPARAVHAILHPGDAVVLEVDIPPLPASRMEAAVHARVEPLALSELSTLCIAHGPRDAGGKVQVAWASRQPLLEAWRLLSEAGLEIRTFTPFEFALPENDPSPALPLSLPADARWQAALPRWSLAQPEWGPSRHALPWRGALRWLAAAAILWTAGLQLHAAQLRAEVNSLQAHMEARVREAFPSIPAILDPLRQARTQVEQLRQGRSTQEDDEFLELALASARLPGFAEGHVTHLSYADGRLTLKLAEGRSTPADESAMQAAASAAGLRLEKDAELDHVWHVRAAQPNRGGPA